MICPWCNKEFEAKGDKRFCSGAHKDAWHNREKAEQIHVSREYRLETQEYATAWGVTFMVAADRVYALGLKWTERGKPIPRIFGDDSTP